MADAKPKPQYPPFPPAAASSVEPARLAKDTPDDPHVEKLRAARHPTWLLAYMRDMTRVLHHSIQSLNAESHPHFVGRAFPVQGPEVYLDALEGIPPGSVYVQGGCGPSAVFSPGWTHAYVKPRGGVAVVVDGGVYKSFECGRAAVPMFASYSTPSIAINRRAAPLCPPEGARVAGVLVGPGDIVVGDADGVVVIPRAKEDEMFAKMDAFIHANGCFGKIASRAIAAGTPMTQEPALADMFERKYAHPEDYWRCYQPWWAKWRVVEGYTDIEQLETDEKASRSFYSSTTAPGAAVAAGS